jgi:hypothetical protein
MIPRGAVRIDFRLSVTQKNALNETFRDVADFGRRVSSQTVVEEIQRVTYTNPADRAERTEIYTVLIPEEEQKPRRQVE